MDVYIAIGYFKSKKDNITCVAYKDRSKKDFIDSLRSNEFVAYSVFSKYKMCQIEQAEGNSFDLYNLMKGVSSSYKAAGLSADYLEQCLDIIQDKIEKAKEEEDF